MHTRKLKDENGKDVFVVVEDSNPYKLVFKKICKTEKEATQMCENPKNEDK